MSERIDMSLDDIIKLDRKKKKAQGVVAGKGLKQFRGRVGGTTVRKKNTAKGANGISPLNRKQSGLPKRRPFQQGGNVQPRNQRQSLAYRQMAPRNLTKGILRKRANLAIKQASLRQFQQQRKRQNMQNQNRGQVLQSLHSRLGNRNRGRLNRNTGTMVADQLIEQQKKQRRWKAKQQKQNNQNDGIMTVSVKNDRKSSDVQVHVGNKQNQRLRINRNSTSSLVKTVQLQTKRNNIVQQSSFKNRQPVLLVTSPTTKNMQYRNSSEQVRTPRQDRRKLQRQKKNQMNMLNQMAAQVQLVSPGQMRGQGRQRGRGFGNQNQQNSFTQSSGSFQVNRNQQFQEQRIKTEFVPNIQADVRKNNYNQRQQQQQQRQERFSSNFALQQQIKSIKPTVHHEYVFERTDFGRASTGMTLNDRFRSVTYNEAGGSSFPGGSRLVYM